MPRVAASSGGGGGPPLPRGCSLFSFKKRWPGSAYLPAQQAPAFPSTTQVSSRETLAGGGCHHSLEGTCSSSRRALKGGCGLPPSCQNIWATISVAVPTSRGSNQCWCAQMDGVRPEVGIPVRQGRVQAR